MSTSFRVVLGLLGVCLLALAVTGSPVYSRLSYLWAILLIGTFLWSRLSLLGIQLTRQPRSRRAQMGQIFEERFDVVNSNRLPRLWVEVHDQTSLPNSMGSQVLTMIGGRQRRSYLSRTRLLHRGVFPLGPTQINSGDPFGIFPTTVTYPFRDTLLVYPYMVDVRVFPNPPGLLSGGEATKQRTLQATTNAAGVREYSPGDSLNRIHWLSTARRDRLMVKEFELDPLSDVWILLDAERAVHYALPYEPPPPAADVLWQPKEKTLKLPPATEEYVASIAASLARYFIRQGRSVGMACDAGSLDILPPDRDSRQLSKILEALALFRAQGILRFSALVTTQAQHLTRGSTVILITPSIHDQVPIAVDYLHRRGLHPIVILLDAGSFGGPEGASGQELAIRLQGAPIKRIENGVDLEHALNHVGI